MMLKFFNVLSRSKTLKFISRKFTVFEVRESDLHQQEVKSKKEKSHKKLINHYFSNNAKVL